ncbi:MAG: hypothetical protein MRY76_03345 [Pseudomonadales bacterium]|nr:hypothetical protein [Pseudomonadales bacterium]
MIFSLLNVRKKTAATLAGIAIAALCLWGLSMWQDISIQELVNILLAVIVLLGAVMAAALVLIVGFKLILRLVDRIAERQHEKNGD